MLIVQFTKSTIFMFLFINFPTGQYKNDISSENDILIFQVRRKTWFMSKISKSMYFYCQKVYFNKFNFLLPFLTWLSFSLLYQIVLYHNIIVADKYFHEKSNQNILFSLWCLPIKLQNFSKLIFCCLFEIFI